MTDYRKKFGLALALCVALFLAWVLAGSPL